MRSRRARPKVVIYVSGPPEEQDKQQQWCLDMCDRRRYEVYGIAREKGDGVAWVDARLLLRSGIVERIIVYSEDVIPIEGIESVAGALSRRPQAGAKRATTPRLRRPRPVR